MGPLNAYAGSPKDFALVVGVLLHVLLGFLLTLVHWTAGGGLATLIVPARARTLSRVFLLGFPLGLILLAIWVSLALGFPHGRLSVALLWAISVVPLFRWRAGHAELRALLWVSVLMLPFAAIFGTMMGLLWHGPTETLSASTAGDITFYASCVCILAQKWWPFRNLGSEGETLSYFNSLFPGIGATLSGFPGFDPFLFITVSGATFFALSTGIALTLYVTASGSQRREFSWLRRLALAGAVIVGVRYPSWVVESIPVSQVVPLTIALWFLAKEARSRAGRTVGIALLALLGSALTKVVTLVVLGPAVIAESALGLFRARGLLRGAVIVAGIVSFGYAIWMIWTLGPRYWSLGNFGPESLGLIRSGASPIDYIPLLLRDVATVLLGVAAFRLAPLGLAAAIAGGLATKLIWAFLFHANFLCSTLLIGLLSFDRPERLERTKGLLFTAFLLAAPALFFKDPAGLQAGAVWSIGMGAIAGIAVSRREPLASVRRREWSTSTVWSACAFCLMVPALVAVGRGQLIIDSGRRYGIFPELTPAVRDIWQGVRERTPEDALIFTDQTGSDTGLLGGWNTYAYSGQRQVYIANWVQSEELSRDPERRDQRLRWNEQVLAGAIRPSELPLSRHYGAYYAVVRRDHISSARALELVYQNDTYRLDRLAP